MSEELKEKNNRIEKTFSKEVKEEIASKLGQLTIRQKQVFLAGFVQQTGALGFSNGKMTLNMQTGNAIVARRVYQMLRQDFPFVQIEITIRKMIKLKKQAMYVLKITDTTKHFFQDIYYMDDAGFVQYLPPAVCDDELLFSAYLQGLFLGSGSVNNLNLQSYHLEIPLSNSNIVQEVLKEAKKYGIELKRIKRRNQHVIYIKDSTMIGDFLAFIEATSARFAFEDVRITRDMMNSMNRLINCEVANEQKSQKATQKQIDNIQYILKQLGRGYFNEKENQVIDLRFLYQEATMSELSELLMEEKNIQISKSGLNHIFRKFNKKAEELKKASELESIE